MGCSGSGGGCFSEGVVPLMSIPDVIRLVGRREGAAESRVLESWFRIVEE